MLLEGYIIFGYDIWLISGIKHKKYLYRKTNFLVKKLNGDLMSMKKENSSRNRTFHAWVFKAS